jgi:1,4-dihydroxy-2-naphthoate octaprenyltransferase
MSQNIKSIAWDKWWRMTRPHTLTASFIPVFLGTLLALYKVHLSWDLFWAMLIASILIQIATNLFNEYFDYKRGLDTADSVGIGGSIVRDGFSPKNISQLAKSLCMIALLLGVYICLQTTWWVGGAGIVCMFIGYLYSGGPKPIAYTPFGEVVSGIFMGMFIIWISFFIQTQTLSWLCILVSVPIGILIGGINMSNNIRDRQNDAQKGRRTLPVLLGHDKAVKALGFSIAVAYLWVIGLILLGLVSPFTLLIFLSVPKALKALRGFGDNSSALNMMPAMQATAKHSTLFGFLLGVGLLLGFFF